MPRCPVETPLDWCERHQCRHPGRLFELSQDETGLGEAYRRLWDSHVGVVYTGGRRQRDGVDLVPCSGCKGNVRLKVPAESVKVGGVSTSLTWAVGLTTVPQRRDLLCRTLASVRAAGFLDPRLFVDGCPGDLARAFEQEHGCEVSARNPKLGVWANWWLALHELHLRQPQADRYVIFQDDVVCVKNLRAYLEAWYPDGADGRPKGYLNPFLFLDNHNLHEKSAPGWHVGAFPHLPRVEQQGKWQRGCGALCLVFSREAVVELFACRNTIVKIRTKDHQTWRPSDSYQKIDGAVVNAFNEIGWREWVHSPSLVWHLGTQSTIDKRHPDLVAAHGAQPHVWRRNADTFPGENFDALSLLAKAEKG